MGFLDNLFGKHIEQVRLSKDEIAQLLQADPELMNDFEESYKKNVLDQVHYTGEMFEISAKQAKEIGNVRRSDDLNELEDRIVDELIAGMSETDILEVRSNMVIQNKKTSHALVPAVTNRELCEIPITDRPQLTGNLICTDIDEPACYTLLSTYKQWQQETDPKKKAWLYHHFRQGLDILDLDPVLYQMLGRNPNSMGHWLKEITEAAAFTGFFRIPDTTVIKVPLPILQLTRLDYSTLKGSTLRIVDKFCQKVFQLSERQEYFVKTGVFSSKFDFRNCHVHGEKEVRELGEYLLYISNQASVMAGPLMHPCIYGAATTNEWVVREFIPDKEGNPCIYKGLPLHTEFRVFVDFNSDEILGMSPYWEPEMLKQRFSRPYDPASPHEYHDYIMIKGYENVLSERYDRYKDLVKTELQKIIPAVDLKGQWSVDVMMNGTDFYIIDMALAAHSALSECVPAEKLESVTEDWIPRLSDNNHQEK